MSKEAEKSKRVLVVDDEQIVCQSVEKVLRRKGYELNRRSR